MPAISAPFPRTRHSLLALLASGPPDVRRDAFGTLVQGYWTAVYKYVRVKWRTTPDEAADLTQAFFLRAYEKRYLAGFDSRKARFRTYLRVCVDRFVARTRQGRARLKRGGGTVLVALNFESVEREMQDPASLEQDLETLFHREWLRAVFALAVARLRDRCRASGRDARFLAFERYDLAAAATTRPTYAALADELQVPVTQVTNELAAARRDFRRVVVDVLREQCVSDEEFQNELREWNVR